jgi:hypothetical protein
MSLILQNEMVADVFQQSHFAKSTMKWFKDTKILIVESLVFSVVLYRVVQEGSLCAVVHGVQGHPMCNCHWGRLLQRP